MTVVISGSSGIQNVLGSAASPAESNTTSSNTGMYFPTSTSVGISTNGTLAMTVDASQNVAIGRTPSAFVANSRGFQVGSYTSIIEATGGDSNLTSNSYLSAVGVYSSIATAAASRYQLDFGSHKWYSAASVTAGSVQTFTQAMTLDTSGNLTVPAMYGTTVTTPRNVFIDSTGKMGGISSIRASKNNIAPILNINWLYQISPVTFNYRKRDENGNYLNEIETEIQYGLIAEDVETFNPEFCIYVEKEGQQVLQGVHYDRMISPLIKAIQEQQTLITSLTTRIAALEAR